jgi:putative membrane protein
MVICLFTPIIYKVLHWLANERKEISILLFFALLYASRWAENLPGLSVQGLLFFSFGAFFSIKQIKFIDVMRPLKWGGLFFAIFAWQINCANLMYAGLIVFTVSTTTRILERRKQQNKLAFPLPLVLINSTFFVFAFHSIVLGGILTILKRGIVVPHNELEAFLIYILSPVIMLTVSVGVYWLFYKIAPRIVSIYCGGR